MVSKEMWALGANRSVIRDLFEYGLQQAKVVGPENVFDYSLGNPSIPSPPQVNETVVEILRDMDSIRGAIEQVDREEFDRVVEQLSQARHIYLLGLRSSSFLAGYLNFYFHLIFENVTLVQSNAAGEIFEQMVRIGPGDVLVGICFPRYSKTAVSAVRFARDRGADVIAVTDSKMSPLYRMASASLLVRSDMISFVDSMTAPLSILNALIVAVGQRKDEETSRTFSELERVWSNYGVFGDLEDE